MNKDFPLNRFDFSNLVEYIQPGEELLENFNILDNLAQKNAQQEYNL